MINRMLIAKKKKLVLCNFNARSVRNKTAEIFDYIFESKAGLFTITEHWLTSRDAAIRAELCQNGYKMLDHPRLDRRGGGTGLIYRESLSVENIDAGATVQDSYQFSEWIIKSPLHNLRIVVIYRPPYSADHPVSTSVFVTEFSEYLESLVLCKEQLLITGDFNIHVDDGNDVEGRRFMDMLISFGLNQHVNQTTHCNGHTLDLIVTRMSESLVTKMPLR